MDNRILSDYTSQISAKSRANSTSTGSTASSVFSGLLQNAVGAMDSQKKNSSMEDIFRTASEKYNVPLNLLKAVAKVESGFDADAVSSCGAQGVMQLMPGTAASLGVQNSFDAEQNIMGGAKYLSQMLDRYNGDAKLALAAYNAGSGNVAKYGGVPPFKETQAYISKVLDAAGGDVSAPTDQLSELSSLLTGTLPGTSGLTGLSALTGFPATGAAGTGTSGTSYTYDDYLTFLQLYIAQMQMNTTQMMSSDISGLSSSDTDSSMSLL
ncbi:lytic transglycosylase domain-containing protein [Caproiciproducens faecalis]|uniref:Lytic transglycosylase domain-containing protein n=1 Tax=Caproiciproducens faecalis TaxID=2820301 RepID=A0ABS7DPA6_9FIRM|nr:lytic transglycosylase domain-containing protein [Caproiciproducens faecalis]MBW7573102.1 lytic transglycosylase domain-containing protein [Caproiciproducens faecalis]